MVLVAQEDVLGHIGQIDSPLNLEIRKCKKLKFVLNTAQVPVKMHAQPFRLAHILVYPLGFASYW